MNILFLTTILPGGQRMGSEVASQAIINALNESGHQLSITGFVRKNEIYKTSAGEIPSGARDIETRQAGLNKYIWLVKSLLTKTPYSIVKFQSAAYARLVSRLVKETHFDLAIIDHVQMNWIIDILPPDMPLIGVTHNVEQKMYGSFAKAGDKSLRSRLFSRESRLLAEVEKRYLERLQHLWVFTEDDAAYYRSIKEAAVSIVTLPATSVNASASSHKEFDIGLVGSWSWEANEEGLRWFIDDVYPHLSEDLNIHIAGSGAEWLNNNYENISYLGFVDDVQEFLRKARVVAIPTLSGGGIQIKTLDAIASGSSIVATSLASRGIDDAPETINTANTPEKFANELSKAVHNTQNPATTLAAMNWALERKTRLTSELEHCITTLLARTYLS
ncbi:MAG: glycosyltransferase family 4 protein [Pseudomonadota bacterium]